MWFIAICAVIRTNLTTIMSWHNIDIDNLPRFRPRIVSLVRHVYRQTGRPLRGGGDSLHYNQTQISYCTSQTHTSYINIAEGDDDMWGAQMVYSVNTASRKIKQKLKNNVYVSLNTDEFNTLLDDITEHVHGRQCKLPSPDIDDFVEAAYEEMALMAEQEYAVEQEEEQEEQVREEEERGEEQEQKRRRETLHTSSSGQQVVQLPVQAAALQQPSQAAAVQQHADAAAQQAPLPHQQSPAQQTAASHTLPGQHQPSDSAADSEKKTPVAESEAQASSAGKSRGKKRGEMDS